MNANNANNSIGAVPALYALKFKELVFKTMEYEPKGHIEKIKNSGGILAALAGAILSIVRSF